MSGIIAFLALLIFNSLTDFTQSQSFEDVEEGAGLPDNIQIGGLFDEGGPEYQAAFKHAVERVNRDNSILPRSTLSGQIEQLEFGDSHHAAEKTCQMMSNGIGAIFGPQSPEAASHVQSICDAFELPHIETKWDHYIRRDNYLINVAPHPDILSRAYNDLLEAFGWTKYFIIYENNDSLYLIQDILKANNPPERLARLKKLPEGDDFRPLLKEIIREDSIHKIVLVCGTEKLPLFFKHAQQVGMLTFKYSLIVTSLDLHTLDLDDFKFGDMNITAFRLVDPERAEVWEIVKEWNALNNGGGGGSTNSYYNRHLIKPKRRRAVFKNKYSFNDEFDYDEDVSIEGEPQVEIKMMPTETALIYDAVALFAKALHILDSSQHVEISPLSCESKQTWQHGYSIINFMKMVPHYGLTGHIHFNPAGYRTDLQLDVIQLKEEGLQKVGTWDSKFIVTKVNWTNVATGQSSDAAEEAFTSLQGKHLIVTTIMNDPFIMLKRSTTPLSGNAQFEGFTVDLLENFGALFGFTFDIRLVADGSYGSLNKQTGKWNGMIQEVMDGVADMAVADLTVNKDRQKALDFTMPFMNLGISILFVEPKKKAPELFSFMNPFEPDVWMYTFYGLIGVSTIMFLCGRLSPLEWNVPHPCIDDPEELENQFTFLNSLWFTSGALLGGGSDVAPIATSTRIIAASWWFFTLIMVSSYTANLASFLLVQLKDEPIKNLEDLRNQDVIKYGCVGGGSTAAFFKNSPFPERRAMWTKMDQWNKETPGILPKNNQEGVQKVVNEAGKYAFFMESTVIEYQVERVCGITQVGGFLDNKGYGIGTKKGTPYRQLLNGGVLKLQETGVLEKLKRKWWMEERKGSGCGDEEEDSGALGIDNVAGCFVVLFAGCVLATVFVFIELFLEGRKTAAERGKTVIGEMRKDLRIAFTSLRTVKPVDEDFDGEFEDKEDTPPKDSKDDEEKSHNSSSEKSA